MTATDAIYRLQLKVKTRGVRLAAPLTESEVAGFERSAGLNLPTDYREFLLHLGNGGRGPPAYGLCALSEFPSDYNFPTPDLAKPFPFTKTWVWENGEISDEGSQADVYCGLLILGTDGCAQYWAIIVNGPDFGKIWMLADVGITPLIPSKTFLEWYEAWLDGNINWWGLS